MELKRHDYGTREALAEALAAGVAAILAGGIATRGEAVLAVSGGSTPRLLFQHLSQAQLDWARVIVCLVDERWVPESDERSNARLVRETLLQGPAGAARTAFLFRPDEDPETAMSSVSRDIAGLSRPFDVTLLGMGSDGHTASFFPHADRLAEALDPETPKAAIAIRAAGAPEPRITLTLQCFCDSRFLALHIEGAEKQHTLSRAMEDGPVDDMPVRAVLRHPRSEPLQVFWAP